MRIDFKNQNLGLDKINLEGKLELKKWKDKNKKQKRKKKGTIRKWKNHQRIKDFHLKRCSRSLRY